MLTVYTLTEAQTVDRDSRAEELIASMSRGDSSAIGELYELLKTDIYAYALSKTANVADAEDITHDTFVSIWKSSAQYTPMGKPLAWIFTIEMNLIRKQFGRGQRFVALDESIDVETADTDFTREVHNKELIRRLLSSLGEDEREIITLHIVSGLKHREIAKLLGNPLSTVLSKYNRAIKKLQIQVMGKEER